MHGFLTGVVDAGFCKSIEREREAIVTLGWIIIYRAEKKSWYVVARNFFLLLLNFSAWPCLGAA